MPSGLCPRRRAIAALATCGGGALTRGFVVGSYEYAFHYGGRRLRAPGRDRADRIAHGSTVHFSNDVQVKTALQRQTWRSPQEVDNISKPPGLEQVKALGPDQFHIWDRAVSYRGWRKGIETYVNLSRRPIPASREVNRSPTVPAISTARPILRLRQPQRRAPASTMRCTGPGAVTRPGAATATPPGPARPTTGAGRAFTPW